MNQNIDLKNSFIYKKALNEGVLENVPCASPDPHENVP